MDPMQILGVLIVTALPAFDICFTGNGFLFGVSMIQAALLGIVLGNPTAGVLVGTTVQLAFMGVIMIGAAVPPDPTIAAQIATITVITTGITVESSLAIAWPVALLGMYLGIANMTVLSSLMHLADKFADEGNTRGIMWANFLAFPIRLAFAWIPIGIFIFLGLPAVNAIVNGVPAQVWTALTAAGRLMTILGVSMILSMMFQMKFLPLYALAFALAAFAKFNLVAIAMILAGIIGAIYLLGRKESIFPATESVEKGRAQPKGSLTGGDLLNTFIRSLWLQTSLNYERMEALGYIQAVWPLLKRWKKDEKERKEWLKMHLEYYNTQPHLSNLILGIDLALTEQGGDIDTVRALKVGLIGPLAGIGDSLMWFTLLPICLLIGISYATGGNMLGIIVFEVLWVGITWPLRYYLLKVGYEQGTRIAGVFTEERLGVFREVMGAFGVGMLGALTVLFVGVTTPLTIVGTITLQSVFDALLPSLLPLISVFLCYRLLKKGWSVLKLVAVIFIVGFVLGYLGIIA